MRVRSSDKEGGREPGHKEAVFGHNEISLSVFPAIKPTNTRQHLLEDSSH